MSKILVCDITGTAADILLASIMSAISAQVFRKLGHVDIVE